jgi:nitrite reductase/ring-hydroxylating ferredoxin subunit
MQSSSEVPRPRSTFKVLGGLFLAIVFALALMGLCVSAIISNTPRRTLEVPRLDLGVDQPRFYPLPSFGADASGRTFGVWLVRRDDGTADAYYSRDPRTGCYLPWRADFTFEGRAGWFRDPCHGSTYDMEGTVVFGPAVRNVDEFDTEVTETEVIVDLEQIRLGDCRTVDAEEHVPCSEPGNPRYEDEQPTLLEGTQAGGS